MTKKITQEKVVQTDLWKNTTDSTKGLIEINERLNESLAKTAGILKKSLNSNRKEDFEGLKSAESDVNKLNKAYEDKIKIDKQRLQLEKQLLSANDKIEKQRQKDLALTKRNAAEVVKATEKKRLAIIKNQKEKQKSFKKLLDQEKKEIEISKKSADAAAKSAERKRLSELKLQKDRELAFDRFEKKQLKETANSKKVADAVVKSAERKRLAELKLQKDREAAFDRADSKEKKEIIQANKEQAKQAAKLTDEYQNQSKKLNSLRKELKNLLLVEGKATKETRRLEKEVGELDRALKDVDAAAGQFQRNVGDYPDTLGDASTALLKTAAAALTVKGAFDAVKTSLDSTEDGSEDIRKVAAVSDGVTNSLKSSIAELVVGMGKAVVNGFDVFMNGADASLGSTSDLLEGINKATGSFDDFKKKVVESSKAEIEATEAAIDHEKAIRLLNQRLAIVNGTIEDQTALAGDSTRSFDAITKAAIAAQAAQTERASIQIQIAQEELVITRLLIDAQEKAGTSSIELLNRESENVVALQDARNQASVERIETDKLLRQTNQDLLEIELDVLIDGFDNQKTINERKIANEKETLDNRARLLEETNKLGNESFKAQKEVLAELSAAGIDVDGLLKLDATELAQEIRLLQQSEIINTRTLEVIRERRTVLQDLEDAQSDLNDSQQEGLDIDADILAQEEALLKQQSGNAKDLEASNKKLENDRFENEIESLERKLKLTEEGSIEEKRLQQELNDLLIDENQRRIDKEIEAEKKKNEDEIGLRKSALSALRALNDKFFSDKIEKADLEIESTKDREGELATLAATGNADAAAALSENQKNQDEAAAKKEQLLRREQQAEFALSIIQSFNTALDNDATVGEALLAAGTSTVGLTALIGSLPSFLEGTPDTGNSGKLDGNGGHLAVLHDNERVVDKENNTKMGGVSNDFAANTIQDFNQGLLTYNTPQLMVQENKFESNEEILKKFDSLERSLVSAIKDKETYLGTDIDIMKQLLSQNFRKGNTKTIVKSKYTVER